MKSLNDLLLVRDVWSLDEKMGQTYIRHETANTLAARDYKQPQAVAYAEYKDTDNTE